MIFALALLLAACSSEPEDNGVGPTATAVPAATETPIPTDTPAPTPPTMPTSVPEALLEWSDEDCIFRPEGELGELTRVFRTYVENEAKLNIDRVFLRFHQSETESTILRCDMSTAGYFTTWWVQSFATDEEARQVFNSFVQVTAPEVSDRNGNLRSCYLIRPAREGDDSYQLDFVDKGICEADVFNGRSGIVQYGNTVIGIDSQFYEEFFELLLAHAKAVVDKRASS